MVFTMEQKITEWLTRSGYPLELAVYAELLSRGYRCAKSEMYIDPETGTRREIDVTAFHFGETEASDYAICRNLVLECKKSDKPLLNLCAEQGDRRSRFYHHAFYGDPEDFLRPDCVAYVAADKLDREARLNAIGGFAEEVPLGYSVVRAFGGSDSTIYSGLMGLVKASSYYRKEYVKFFKESRSDRSLDIQDRNVFEFHLAALIVDAPLFDVFVEENGSVAVHRSDWSMVNISVHGTFRRMMIVDTAYT